jgi:hypothetical protein
MFARYAPARRSRYALKSGVLDAPPGVLVGEIVVGQVEPVQGVARGVMWMAVGQRSAIWKLMLANTCATVGIVLAFVGR